MEELIAQIIDSVQNSSFFGSAIDVWKEIAIISSLILGFCLVIVVYKLRGIIKEEFLEVTAEISPPEEPTTAHDARWAEIKRHFYSDNNSEWKFAVIEADKLVEDVLKSAGFPGDTMGDRLMSILPGQLPHIDALWKAHKMRNSIAHDHNFQLHHGEVMEVIDIFEVTLRELGAID